jgi:hypothetical protein
MIRYRRYSTSHPNLDVDIAIVRGTGDTQESVFGRIADSTIIYECVDSGGVDMDGDCIDIWLVHSIGGRDRSGWRWLAGSAVTGLLDEGLDKCWADYEQFLEAERGMGDPNP